MFRGLIGLLKGAVVGAALGYGAFTLGVRDGALAYLTQALIGFVVGVVCGKPLWRHKTLWTPALKGTFGALVAAGMYWGARALLGDAAAPGFLSFGGEAVTTVVATPHAVGTLIGLVWGVLIELDEGRPDEAAGKGVASKNKGAGH